MGAIRIYVEHEDWQKAVKHLMSRSAMVFVVIGEGQSLWWEIEAALAIVPNGRLAFFFPMADHEEGIPFWPRSRIAHADTRRQQRYELFLSRVGGRGTSSLPRQIGSFQVIVQTEDGTLQPLQNRFGYQAWYKRLSRRCLNVLTLGAFGALSKRITGLSSMFDQDVEVSLPKTLRGHVDRVRAQTSDRARQTATNDAQAK